MWPYDYFNQFSNIEIDNRIGAIKKIFFAIWYADDDSRNKARQEGKIIAFKEVVKGLKIEDLTFEPVVAKEIKSGDFNENILSGIIKSTFVVCDVTPIKNYRDGIFSKKSVFNPNVMVELGLALAWKMPEQVIVLWDEEDKRFPEDLASDVHSYHIDKIDAKYKKLPELIQKRYDDFLFKKDIILKNVKSKIDADSLKLLATTYSNHGLLFSFGLNEESFFIINILQEFGIC